jgi:peptidoglycan/xylan/chitin deacetylase (PgdA/CDA1 family)
MLARMTAILRLARPTLAAALAVVSIPARAQQPPPAWTLTEPEIQQIVGRVRAGRDLSPKTWPGGARVAVGLSFDFDNETLTLRDGGDSVSQLSQGEYGARRGLARVLALLDRHAVKATFFVPAVSALLHTASMKAIVAGGHEVALHGWIHERNSQLDAATERALLTKALETLTMASGRRPVGMRTPSWDYSGATIAIARDLGLLYDSSLMADDAPYEVMAGGTPTGIVELPVEWILDDAPYFTMDRFTSIRPTMNQHEVLAIWKSEFDVAHAEGGLFILTMHPHIIGHRNRAAMLEELVAHMKAKTGVWFATHEAIAAHVRREAGLAPPPAAPTP